MQADSKKPATRSSESRTVEKTETFEEAARRMGHLIQVEVQRWCFEFEPESAKDDHAAQFLDLAGLGLRAIGQVVLPGRGNEPVHAEVRFVRRTDPALDIEGKITLIAANLYTPEFLSVGLAIPEPMWRRLWDKATVVKTASVLFWIEKTEDKIPFEQTFQISGVRVSLTN